VQKVISGQITAIEPRQNDWVAVHVSVPGKQYPTKLSTKRPDLVGIAQQLYGQFVDALYNEEQSTTINPHNNQPYTNRYLEQLAPGGSGQIQQPVQQGLTPVAQTIPQVQANWQQPGYPTQPVQQPMQQPVPGPQPQPMQPQVHEGMPPGWQPQQTIQQPLPPQSAFVADDERENRIMRQAATKVAAVFLPMLTPEDQNLGSLIRIAEQLLKYYREGVSWETFPPEVPAQVPGQNAPQSYDGGYDGGDPGREAGDPGYQPVPGELPAGY
jgi:hypothetical protein